MEKRSPRMVFPPSNLTMAHPRRAQLRASAQQRALALDAQVPTTAPQRRPATAPPGRLDGAARARQQGHRAAEPGKKQEDSQAEEFFQAFWGDIKK